ncbi:Nicotinamide-nucleotide amidase [hydrothermal vent metagenome]|uniref:Nicotinamide-nucleotide amidase n=1 Tax=hydrothermal vent metagenome TaxID=652676 RepID=A0A3B1D9L0_9ZZZZ
MKETNLSHHEKALPLQIGGLLQEHHLRLATAESCTGGQIASQITAVAGASDYFESGVITYSNAAKTRILSVPEELIEEKGAVSAEVAQAMAEGVRKNEKVALGLSVTGIAGPEGGSDEKPVGLVFIALAHQNETEVKRFRLSGDRKTIQYEATQIALEILLTYLRSLIKPLKKRPWT